MEDSIKHSFAVMAYGKSPYIEACILSLLHQSVKSNLYITTSTPSDYLSELALKYEIPLIVNPAQPSLATDWQFALDECKTPLLTLAHQDDVYYEDYAKHLTQAIVKQEGVIAFCDYEEIVGEKTRSDTQMLKIKRLLLWPYIFKKSLKSRFGKRLVLRFGSAICCPSVLFNLDKARIQFDAGYRNDLDWDAWLRLCDEKGSFVYINKILMAHRIHEDSETTKQISNNTRYLEDKKMFMRLWPKPLAHVFSSFYKRSYQSNKIPRGAK